MVAIFPVGDALLESDVSTTGGIHNLDLALLPDYAHPVHQSVVPSPKQDCRTTPGAEGVVEIVCIVAEALQPNGILENDSTFPQCGINGHRKSSFAQFQVLAELLPNKCGDSPIPPSANTAFRIRVEFVPQLFVRDIKNAE